MILETFDALPHFKHLRIDGVFTAAFIQGRNRNSTLFKQIARKTNGVCICIIGKGEKLTYGGAIIHSVHCKLLTPGRNGLLQLVVKFPLFCYFHCLPRVVRFLRPDAI